MARDNGQLASIANAGMQFCAPQRIIHERPVCMFISDRPVAKSVGFSIAIPCSESLKTSESSENVHAETADTTCATNDVRGLRAAFHINEEA